MEQAIPNALERIDNPILIILIVMLLVAVIALWWALQKANARMVEILVANISAIKDMTTATNNLAEKISKP